MTKYSIGIDYGTESARAILVDIETGQRIASSVYSYPSGVIDKKLSNGEPLPPEWALQHPVDWLEALANTIPQILKMSGVDGDTITGIGVDFTSCTILPVLADGTPLCLLDENRRQPHAWPKLWKHHAAQRQANRINEIAEERGEPWLPRYGGKLSSEWVLAKSLQMAEDDPALYAKADRIVEGADWIVWQLTGTLARNSCASGYKATWNSEDGYPGKEFLEQLHPNLTNLYEEKLQGPIQAPGVKVGGLSSVWAEKLGLPPGLPVASPIIDAHAAVLGGGVSEPNTLFMIMGTSTCHMLMAEQEVFVEGVSGVVLDGIIPGYYGYEAGQAAVGDIFAWFTKQGVPEHYHTEAVSKNQSLHQLLSEKAGRLQPGESGLLALDWWNGNRSTLNDARLNGLLLGLTLSTKPEEIYRALIEATAFGTKKIIEAFENEGVKINAIVAGGGLTQNDFLMQLYADITGISIAVAGAEQVSALGAAMLGAVAGDGYGSVSDAVRTMAPPPKRTYRPREMTVKAYDALYGNYSELYDYFGRSNALMKNLWMNRQRAGSRES